MITNDDSESDFGGLLLRFEQQADDLILVLEPGHEAHLGALGDGVDVIKFHAAKLTPKEIEDISINTGEHVWGKVKIHGAGCETELSLDWAQDIHFRCASFSKQRRPHEILDLKQKLEFLAINNEYLQKLSTDLTRDLSTLHETFENFISKKEQSWKVKESFLAASHPDKAVRLQAKLEVLEELRRILPSADGLQEHRASHGSPEGPGDRAGAV